MRRFGIDRCSDRVYRLATGGVNLHSSRRNNAADNDDDDVEDGRIAIVRVVLIASVGNR